MFLFFSLLFSRRHRCYNHKYNFKKKTKIFQFYLSYLWLKTHIKHSVCFVKNEKTTTIKPNVTLFHDINQTSRSSN